MRLGVDAAREPADDDEPGRGELAPEAAGDLAAVGGAGAGADDRDRRPREQRRPVASPRTKRPGGGSWIARSSGGKPGSERARNRKPSRASRSSSARGSNAALNDAKRALRGSPTRWASFAAANDASASSFTRPAPSASGRRAPRRRAPAAPRRSLPARLPSARRERPVRGRDRTAATARRLCSAARPRPSSGASASPVSLPPSGRDPLPDGCGRLRRARPRAPPPAAAAR